MNGHRIVLVPWFVLCVAIALGVDTRAAAQADVTFERITSHQFNPLNDDGSFTSDRDLRTHGIADLSDDDWRVRLLALRDLIRVLPQQTDEVLVGLQHRDPHVRQIAAAALGITREKGAARALRHLLENDDSALVRSQAAMSLGQLESTESLGLLRESLKNDRSRDVRHQCELAIDQIEKQQGATPEQLAAFSALDEAKFEQVRVDSPALDFTLNDTDGAPWTLSKDGDGRWVVLVWIFADWCPVCHSEFSDLISMKDEFAAANTVVATIECHDRYRCRLMVGKELDAAYWFAKNSFQAKYQQKIWWPHLSDLAGAVGSQYGVDPMSFAVHAEYVNRPSTIIIDPQGIVRLAYYGTFWGDRPTMHETLEMIKIDNFNYAHPKRLK